MVWSLFFIVGTVFSNSGVLAVSDVSENVRTGSSNDDSGLYVYGSSDQDMLSPSDVGEVRELQFPDEYYEEVPTLEQEETRPTGITTFDFVGGGGSSGGGGASIGGGGSGAVTINSRVSALERWVNGHDNWAAGLSRRVNSLEGWVNSHNIWANNLSNRVTSIHNWAINQFNVQNNRWSDQYRKNNDNWEHWKTQWRKNDDNYGHWKTQWSKNNDNWEHWKTQWKKNDDNWGHWKTQWSLNNSNKANWESQWKKNNDNWGHWKTQWALNDSNKANWESQWKKNNDNWEHWKTQWALNTKQATTNQKFETFITNQNARNVDFQTQIDNLKNNFNWSDVGIITALVAIKDSLDTLKDQFSVFKNWFEVYSLEAVSPSEGDFVRMIKTQFISLKNHLSRLNNSQLNNLEKYFGVEGDGENLTPTGIFTKYLGDQIYRLRYSMVAGFGEIEDVLKLINTDTLGIRDSLNTVNLNLTAVNNWLKAIFDKPVGSVIAPPFDFNRLEQILRSLNFGNATNEAGTNLWDFLTSLIDNLGNIIGKGIDGLSSTLGKILDILGGLVDTIIGLIVPKNWDFLEKDFGNLKGKFDTKFKFFLDLGGLVQNLFKPTKQDFLKAISFTWLGVNFDFTQSQSSLDIYVPKFRLAIAVFIWAITAIYIYRKITGTGDVINDS